MPSSDRPTRTPAASIENATAGDVLQLSGDPDHRPLLITQPFNWWRFRRRVPGLPDTWFITEEAPAPRCLGARSPTAVVMTFARLSDLKRAWIFSFFQCACDLSTNEHSPEENEVGRLFSGKEMGQRAEPMQWIAARHRENSGERGEEPGDPDTPGRNRRVDVRGSQLASAPTLSL